MKAARIALIGCSDQKKPGRGKARDIYCSQLFRAALAHAEANFDAVFILSARYGLVGVDQEIDSYDERLSGRQSERAHWARNAWSHLCNHLCQRFGTREVGEVTSLGIRLREIDLDAIELHIFAGSDYLHPFAADRAAMGGDRFTIEEPLAGLQVGQRLAWFKARRGTVAA